MPGHRVSKDIFKSKEQYDRHICAQCCLLMKDVVQPNCGHRLCQSCAEEILQAQSPPLCPHQDCREVFTDEDGAHVSCDLTAHVSSFEYQCERALVAAI